MNFSLAFKIIRDCLISKTCSNSLQIALLFSILEMLTLLKIFSRLLISFVVKFMFRSDFFGFFFLYLDKQSLKINLNFLKF